MNKESNTNLSKVIGYESPAADVLSISTEGILCSSGNLDINDWEENNDVL